MALKDWKKASAMDISELDIPDEEFNNLAKKCITIAQRLWKNGKFTGYRIRNLKYGDELILFLNPTNDMYDVLLENELAEQLLNTFKTKNAAEKFMQRYMKKY